MRQSIEDGVTLQIIYEGRTHKAEVPDQAALDAAFEDVFSEYDLQEHLKACSDPSKHETSTKSFKLPFGGEDEGVSGDVGILIVNNVLLTGFDAPVERVMYLDKVVVAHNLLQAIARVNRVAGESKDKGFVVDYVGIGHHLKVDRRLHPGAKGSPRYAQLPDRSCASLKQSSKRRISCGTASTI